MYVIFRVWYIYEPINSNRANLTTSFLILVISFFLCNCTGQDFRFLVRKTSSKSGHPCHFVTTEEKPFSSMQCDAISELLRMWLSLSLGSLFWTHIFWTFLWKGTCLVKCVIHALFQMAILSPTLCQLNTWTLTHFFCWVPANSSLAQCTSL